MRPTGLRGAARLGMGDEGWAIDGCRTSHDSLTCLATVAGWSDDSRIFFSDRHVRSVENDICPL